MSDATADSIVYGNEELKEVLRTERLIRRFGSLTATNDIDLVIPEGELHSIIGPNGAGKTTLFNLITGALRPTAGQVRFRGEDITEASADERARMGIVRAFQITQLFRDTTIHENLRLAVQATAQDFNPLHQRRSQFDERATAMLERLDINVPPDTIAKTLSHGDKKKLEIGMALISDPDLLLLDEPTSGVSGSDSRQIVNFLKEVTATMTVLLIEHDVDMVLELSDRITVLHQGAIIARGTPEEIIENEQVQKAYLGGY